MVEDPITASLTLVITTPFNNSTDIRVHWFNCWILLCHLRNYANQILYIQSL